MAHQVGDDVVFQGQPGTVVRTKTVGSVQYDTVLFEQPVVRVLDDSLLQGVPPANPATPSGPNAVPHTPTPAKPTPGK